MKILVTGGLGFIGSHTVVELLEKNYEVVIIDDLSNSDEKVLDGIKQITAKEVQFEKIDLKDRKAVVDFFALHSDIQGVIHFAASKAVGESVENPLLYYENNLSSLVYLLKELLLLGKANFIFSSSCTVYGEADQVPITEEAEIKPALSPYGNTKQIGEEIIKDSCKAHPNLNAISLRYFNPIGAHPSALIGELPLGVPQNLVPFITQTAVGLRSELSVFGDDYPTEDGTCIRDYIYVVDLAKAHVKALERLMNQKASTNYEVFNLGTGKGSSVLDVIRSFERISEQKLPYRIASRREGDVVKAFADTKKANEELQWSSETSLDEALLTALQWEKKIKK
jgi:UDP-glucose 4-epimerase